MKQHELQRYVLDEIETDMFALQDSILKTAKEIEAVVTYNMDYVDGNIEHKMEDVSTERVIGRVEAFKQVLQMLYTNILEEMNKDKL